VSQDRIDAIFDIVHRNREKDVRGEAVLDLPLRYLDPRHDRIKTI
jgi:hypothetical protein